MEDKTTPPQPLPYNNQLPTTSVQQSLPETNSNNTAAIPAISHSKKKSLIVLGIRLFLILICLVFIYIYLTSTLSSMISSLIIFILGLVIIFTPKLFKKHNNSTKNYVLSIIYFFCLLVIIIGLLPIKFNQSSKFIEKKLFNSYSSIDFPKSMILENKHFSKFGGSPGVTGTYDYKFYYSVNKDLGNTLQEMMNAIYKSGFTTPAGEYPQLDQIAVKGTGNYYTFLANKKGLVSVFIHSTGSNSFLLDFNWYSSYQSYLNNPATGIQ